MCANDPFYDELPSGYYSCDFVGGTEHWLGSLGYEQSDADTFTQWGADYLKVCCVPRRYDSRDPQATRPVR